MERRHRPAPEWQAPPTLLPRVLAAVAAAERRAALAPAPVWPPAARLALVATAVTVLAAPWLARVPAVQQALAPRVQVLHRAVACGAAVVAVARVVVTALAAVLAEPRVLLVLTAAGLAAVALSAITAAGFGYLVHLERIGGEHERP